MKSRGVLQVGHHAGWEVIFDYGSPQNFIVGTTTLFSFTAYGDDYSALALFVENQDASNAVRGEMDASHGGTRVCDDLHRFTDVAAGKEGLAVIEYSNPSTYARGQVVNSSPGTVVGRWALLGKRRT